MNIGSIRKEIHCMYIIELIHNALFHRVALYDETFFSMTQYSTALEHHCCMLFSVIKMH